jgi:nitrite reductase (NADH) large subunit
VRTADRLERTATWFNKLEGGIAHLRAVVTEDSLGICAELEEEMQRHVDSYRCEWTEVVKNPELRMRFRHFAGTDEADESIAFERQRGQKKPVAWGS